MSAANYIYSIGRQVWHEGRYWAQKTFAKLGGMLAKSPFGGILVVGLAGFLLLALIPLAFLLFFAFLALKIAITLLFVLVRKQNKTGRQLQDWNRQSRQ